MKLTRLDIRALPGVHPGFRIENLSAGVNFITGPNASGKSSIIRSLRYLLNSPQADDPPGLDLFARFDDQEHRWRVQRQGRSCRWELDGQAADRPALPEGDALGCYLVTIEDLFRLEGGNHRLLAEQLRRELNQGYDLSTLRDSTYALQPRIGRLEQRRYVETREALSDIASRQRAVSEQEQRLPRIAKRLDQARSAATETQHLETALQLIETKSKADELETRLSGFSADMRRLHGREAEHLDQFEKRQQSLEQQLEAQRIEVADAQLALEESGLKEASPKEEDLNRQQQRISKLENTEQQLQIQRDNESNAELKLREAQRRLQIDGHESETLPEITKDQLREAQSLAIRLEDQSALTRQLEQRLNDSGGQVDEQIVDRHQRAVHTLRDWLGAPAPRPKYVMTAIFAIAGAAAALAGGFIESAWLSVGAAILMLTSLGAAVISKRSASQPPSKHAESQLRAQDIDPPADWTRWAVQQRLSELEHELTRKKVALERQRQRTDIENDLRRSIEEQNRLESERHAMAENIGFDPKLTTRAMAQFLVDLDAFHDARLELEQVRQSTHQLEQARSELRNEIIPFLKHWLAIEKDYNESSELLSARLQKLQRRSTLARQSRSKLQQAQRDVERLEHELNDSTLSIETLYKEAGLELGQRAELEHRLQRLEQWRDLEHQRRTVNDNANVIRQKLASRPGLIELADAGESEQIEIKLLNSKEISAQLGPLSEEQGNIKARIEQAGLENAREHAMAEVAMAQDRLIEKRAEAIEIDLAHFLIDDIEREHRRESEPPLLENARESFRSFTHHQWDLEFVEGDDIGFRARDLSMDESRSLAELSTGTRMQLLLALRLGQIRLREQSGAALPLIIDEALTTSDAERAGVIMNNLQDLADTQDRQVIYMAAGDHEHHLWNYTTGSAPHLIDLGVLRSYETSSEAPQFEPPAPFEIKPPKNLGAAEYARVIGVPPVNPRQESGSTHVFHLMHDNLVLLHNMLENWRITTLGQLENILQSSTAHQAISDQEVREKLTQRCRITRDWIIAWRIGRGKPLTHETLERARAQGILSDLNIAGVTQRAEQVEWQPLELLRALEAPITWDNGQERRLQSRKLDELRDFLVERGHVDPRKPLTSDDRRQRLVLMYDGEGTIDDIQKQIDWLEAANQDGQQMRLQLE